MNDKRNKAGKLLRRCAAGLLGLILVFSLIQPGLAGAEQNYVCGKEAHTHVDGCYETKTETVTTKVLKCSLDVPAPAAEDGEAAPAYVHTHNDDCYEGETLVCPLKEIEEHTHDKECYGTEPQCGKEAVEAHKHSDACQKELICNDTTEGHEHVEACWKAKVCTLEETEGHAHSDACGYNLICEKPVVVLHSHTESCYAPVTVAEGEEEQEPELTCTTPVVENHVHDKDCWEEKTEEKEVKTLICGKEEHEHTDACVEKEEEQEPDLTCGKEEHVHTEECYAAQEDSATQETPGTQEEPAEKTLTCGKEEHTHDETCEAKQEVALKVATLNGTIYTDSTYQTKANDKTVITVTGKLPEDASVMAFPVDLEAREGEKILFAYDIEIVLKDGTVFEPAEGETLLVDIQSETVRNAESEIEVYHASGAGEREKMTAKETAQGVSFDTKHFSVYLGLVKTAANDTGTDNSKYLTTLETVPVSVPDDLFVEVNLFDYDSRINNDAKCGETDYYYYFLNGAAGLKDGIFQVPAATESNTYNPLSNANYAYKLNHQFGIANKLVNGYPMVTGVAGTNLKSLDYLFNSAHRVATMTNGGGLFQLQDGYYQYDSAKNAAYYNPGANKFTLYNGTIFPPALSIYTTQTVADEDGNQKTTTTLTADAIEMGNFLPFNDPTNNILSSEAKEKFGTEEKPISGITTTNGTTAYRLDNSTKKVTTGEGENQVTTEEYTNKDALANEWFGMTVEFDFYMPEGGQWLDHPMVFEFLGDDDVMVFIDDVLVLDISGIHDAAKATVNFADGTIADPASRYASCIETDGIPTTSTSLPGTYNGTTTLRQRFDDAGYTDEQLNNLFKGNTFKEYSHHTLKFYYLERGGSISYCKLKFNMPTLPENSLTVGKKVVNAEQESVIDNGESYTFRVVKNGTNDNYFGEEVTYTYVDVNGNAIQENGKDKIGTTVDGGKFTLKHGEYVRFDKMLHYHPVENPGYVVEEILTGNQKNYVSKVSYQVNHDAATPTDITASTKKVTSSVMEADVSNEVLFTNEVKAGTLEIEKKVTKDGKDDLGTYADRFTGENAKTFTLNVKVGGVDRPAITLKNGEKATIENIIAGTEFIVTESADSAKGYTVTYQKENGDYSNDNLTDKMAAGQTYKVKVINDFQTITPTTTITKHIANPDGGKHQYTFNWWPVAGVEDATEPDTSNVKTVTVSDVEETKESAPIELTTVSTLDLPENGKTKEFFYKFVEVPDSTGKFMHDPAVYVVKLTVTNTNGKLSSAQTIFKNGTEMVGNAPKMEFTNVLLTNLTIKKEMETGSKDIIGTYYMTVEISSDHFKTGMVLDLGYKANATDAANKTYTVTANDVTAKKVTLEDIPVTVAQDTTIKGIPYGSTYTITETNGYGYQAENAVNGTVATVTNKKLEATVQVKGIKKVANPDKKDHTFNFSLTEVDAQGHAVTNSKNNRTATATFKGESGEFVFDALKYETSDLADMSVVDNSKVKKFYYQVKEVPMDSRAYITDGTTYIVEVTLTGKQNELSATYIIKQGNDVKDKIEFSNTILGTLTVKKSIYGGDANDNFKFQLKTADLVNGEFDYEKKSGNGKLTFVNGVAEFHLRDGESLTLYGLPHGLEVQVHEVGTDKYAEFYKVNSSITREGQTVKVDVESKGTTVKYINYEVTSSWLPQTGQLKWPVLVLAALGIGFIGFGFLTKKRKKNGK